MVLIGMNARARAEVMGRRAGRDLRDKGIPTRCPFERRDLAAAWARGYAAGARPRG